jgi:hypothetical protein
MLGGVFNTLIAPVMFSSILEYPLALLAVCFVRTGLRRAGTTADRVFDWVTPLVVGALTVGMIVLVHRAGASPRLALFIPGLIVFSQMKHSLRFAASLTAMLVAGMLTPNANADGTVLHRERTFFGVYRVSIDASQRYRTMFHGTTLHGVEILDPARAGESLTYYHRTGPFGQAFERLSHASHAKEVAVVGLGVGTLAAYARPDQRWTFYEIDPAVERIARAPNGFTFLRGCGDRCNVVLGDARLSLARESDRTFGLFVLDAFSSDSIPVHLITSEAIDLYLKRLGPDGVIAFPHFQPSLAPGSGSRPPRPGSRPGRARTTRLGRRRDARRRQGIVRLGVDGAVAFRPRRAGRRPALAATASAGRHTALDRRVLEHSWSVRVRKLRERSWTEETAEYAEMAQSMNFSACSALSAVSSFGSELRPASYTPPMAETTIPENALHSFVDALDKANMRTAKRFPGDSPARQPVHTVYGGAHLFKADAAQKLGSLGLKSLQDHAPDGATLARALDLPAELADRVYLRVVDKLTREPVETSASTSKTASERGRTTKKIALPRRRRTKLLPG